MALLFYKWLTIFTLFNSKPLPAADYHPFYVSVTEINHNAADKNLEISCKIFTDDFETVLAKNYNTRVDLWHPKNKEQTDKLITDYIRKHLVIKLDGKPINLEYVGFERENEAVWSYLQVTNVGAPKKVEIMNNILYDTYNEEINIMHVSVGGNRKSTKLNYPDVSASFEF